MDSFIGGDSPDFHQNNSSVEITDDNDFSANTFYAYDGEAVEISKDNWKMDLVDWEKSLLIGDGGYFDIIINVEDLFKKIPMRPTSKASAFFCEGIVYSNFDCETDPAPRSKKVGRPTKFNSDSVALFLERNKANIEGCSQESAAQFIIEGWEREYGQKMSIYTAVKRQTILEILLRSERLDDFKNNPQKFLDQAKSLIRSTMQGFIVDGIKYQKIGDQAFYAQELFESEELIGYLNKNMLEAEKSVYDHVIYDSETVEAELAQAFEKNEQVKVYAKLPSWFKVDTPLGSYNPDWAVLFDIDGRERLYFVVESKETHIEEFLRKEAQGKIKCGRAHFAALNTDAQFIVTDKMERLIDQVLDVSKTQGKS